MATSPPGPRFRAGGCPTGTNPGTRLCGGRYPPGPAAEAAMSTAERLMYIVRHGATDWNQSGRIQGHIDIPRNETGQAQARMVSRRLAAFGATALFSSDLLRAYETAQIIGQATGLRVMQKPGLREINF